MSGVNHTKHNEIDYWNYIYSDDTPKSVALIQKYTDNELSDVIERYKNDNYFDGKAFLNYEKEVLNVLQQGSFYKKQVERKWLVDQFNAKISPRVTASTIEEKISLSWSFQKKEGYTTNTHISTCPRCGSKNICKRSTNRMLETCGSLLILPMFICFLVSVGDEIPREVSFYAAMCFILLLSLFLVLLCTALLKYRRVVNLKCNHCDNYFEKLMLN